LDWFTSDTHAFHENIIKYSNRPFSSVDEMNICMANNINAKVQKNHTLYHLGDWAFGGLANTIKFREMINCSNVVLIIGNHDKHHLKHESFRKLFSRIYDLYEVRSEGKTIVLFHYAMRVWDKSHHGRYHLYGHSHGSLYDDPNSLSFDVGVDCHNFQPLNVADVTAIMSKKTFKPIDHHGRRE